MIHSRFFRHFLWLLVLLMLFFTMCVFKCLAQSTHLLVKEKMLFPHLPGSDHHYLSFGLSWQLVTQSRFIEHSIRIVYALKYPRGHEVDVINYIVILQIKKITVFREVSSFLNSPGCCYSQDVNFNLFDSRASPIFQTFLIATGFLFFSAHSNPTAFSFPLNNLLIIHQE